MKRTYDWNEDTITCTCPVCGYKHTKETGTHGKTLEGDEPFVEMDFTLHSEDSSSYYSRTRSHTMYACPKCGVLQLEV